jgi:hypothetical protein
MALRFRKSIKILPGIRVNVGLKGASLNVGPRGASVSIGKQGVYTNTSIPGTGISFRNKISNNSKNERALKQQRLSEQTQTVTKSVLLELQDDGNIIYKDKEGYPLDKKLVSQIWQQQSSLVKTWLENEVEKINDMDLITTIHYDMPNPNNEPQLDEVEFDKEKPNEPKKIVVKKPSFFNILVI